LIAERVYFHHAKIAGSAMLGRAFHEAVLSGECDEAQMYGHSDDSLLRSLESSKATVARELAAALSRRRLHKQVHKYGVDEIAGTQSQDHSRRVAKEILAKFTDKDARREFEDRVSLEVGGKEGDVLLYCPPDKMNLKVARMKIVWQGDEIELSEVTDPVINPRLKEIMTAHQRLWGVWVFVSPGLDADQRDLVKQACDLQFVTHEREQEVRTRHYYQLLVDRELKNQAKTQTVADFYGARSAVVNDLLATAKDDRPFPERLRHSITARFSSGG
jgi:predicted component of type VI protein secretion system